MTWLLIAVLLVGIVAIPLGLGGLWIMLGAVAVGVVTGKIGWLIAGLCAVIAIIAELIEFYIVKRLTVKHGGSRKAFWGAIAGGIIGVAVGAPIFIVGSIIAGFIGCFLGAALVTYAETKEMGVANRVGWGAMVGRAFTAVAKTAAGVTILVLAAAALWK